MKKNYILAVIMAIVFGPMVFSSCEDDETYAEQKERERNAITSFLEKGTCIVSENEEDTIFYVPPIKVISQSEFFAKDSTTDVSKNEYVLLDATGIYMQIVNKGKGQKLQSGQSSKVLNRFIEYNIMGDSIMTLNDNMYYIAAPDVMFVTNRLGVFTASFISGVMRSVHSSSVPEGWLVPLTYINLARYDTPDNPLAKVRIIVPHTSGTTEAQGSVYPCMYEITYERGR